MTAPPLPCARSGPASAASAGASARSSRCRASPGGYRGAGRARGVLPRRLAPRPPARGAAVRAPGAPRPAGGAGGTRVAAPRPRGDRPHGVRETRARLGAAPVFAFAAGGAVGVLLWLAVRVLRPVGTALSDEDLALSVEQRFRSLNDRLAAALDFEQELGHPSRGESEAMMRAVVDEAREEAEGLEFSRAVSARRALRWVGVALGAPGRRGGGRLGRSGRGRASGRAARCCSRTGSGRAPPRSSRWTWAPTGRRSRSTPPASPSKWSSGVRSWCTPGRGARFPTRCCSWTSWRGRGSSPAGCSRSRGARGGSSSRSGTCAGRSLRARGGDDVDREPVYRVEIRVPPRVLAIGTAASTYPAYLDRPPEVVEGGSAAVPRARRWR